MSNHWKPSFSLGNRGFAPNVSPGPPRGTKRAPGARQLGPLCIFSGAGGAQWCVLGALAPQSDAHGPHNGTITSSMLALVGPMVSKRCPCAPATLHPYTPGCAIYEAIGFPSSWYPPQVLRKHAPSHVPPARAHAHAREINATSRSRSARLCLQWILSPPP